MKLNRTALLPRKDPEKEPEHIFVIATEGQHTEPRYFSMPVLRTSERVHIEVLPTLDGKSAPENVFERLKDLDDQYQFGEGDELWLVVDKDDWDINALAISISEQGYSLAVSNPCFELWLVLHFGEHDPDDVQCKHLKKKLSMHLGRHRQTNNPPRPVYPREAIIRRSKRRNVSIPAPMRIAPTIREHEFTGLLKSCYRLVGS